MSADTTAVDAVSRKVPTGTTVLNVPEDELTLYIEYDDERGNSRRQALNVHSECTLGFLKEEIYAQLKIAPEDQILLFGKFELHKESTKRELPEFEIFAQSVIRLQSVSGAAIVSAHKQVATASALSPAAVGPTTDKLPKPKALAPSRPGMAPMSKEQLRRRRQLFRAELLFNDEQRNSRRFLVEWSLYLCRALLVFIELSIVLLIANWGHWAMVYYILGIFFSVVGWFGCRQLSSKFIYFFCFFLCMDMILMLEALITTGEDKKDHGFSSYGMFIFAVLFEMFLVGGFTSVLCWFGWKIHVAKQLSHVVVDVSAMYCREQVIFV